MGGRRGGRAALLRGRNGEGGRDGARPPSRRGEWEERTRGSASLPQTRRGGKAEQPWHQPWGQTPWRSAMRFCFSCSWRLVQPKGETEFGRLDGDALVRSANSTPCHLYKIPGRIDMPRANHVLVAKCSYIRHGFRRHGVLLGGMHEPLPAVIADRQSRFVKREMPVTVRVTSDGNFDVVGRRRL